MPKYPNFENFLSEDEKVLSTLKEENLTLVATDKRLIRYIVTPEGVGSLDLSYDAITSINVFFKQLEKRYLSLSAIGIVLLILSIILRNVWKVLSMEQQAIMFLASVFLIIFGIVFKKTESKAGLGFHGNDIPKIKFDRNEINLWDKFEFRNKDFEEIIEFANIVRNMVNHYRSFREVRMIESMIKKE